MTKNDLQKKVAELLGVSASEKELAFDIFISKIADLLTGDLTIKVPRIGFFQLKKNQNEDEQTQSIVYSSFSEELSKDSKYFYLTIDLPEHKKNIPEPNADADVFSIGVGKPLLPIGEELDDQKTSEASYIILQKSIEERVNEIISESEHLPNFNMWDEYYQSLSQEEPDAKTQLLELTSDIEFIKSIPDEKEDFIADEITNDLLEQDLASQQKDLWEPIPLEKEPNLINEDNLSPSDLLKDYNPNNSQNENFQEEGNEVINEKETHLEENEKVEVKKENKEFEELEIELGKHRKDFQDIDLVKNNTDNLETFNISKEAEINQSDISESTDSSIIEDFEQEKENESYLGLKKKSDNKIEWNWGDELKEELEASVSDRENEYYESYDKDWEEEPKVQDIFRTTKPLPSNLFEELESSIKKELAESTKELSYLKYISNRNKYEFVEEQTEQENLPRQDYEPIRKFTYEEEKNYVNSEYSDKINDKYFGKTFLVLFTAFVIISGLIIYVLIPNKKAEVKQSLQSTQIIDTVNTAKQEIASLPDEKNIPIDEESEFPRVASLPSINKKQTTTSIPKQIIKQEISGSGELYRIIENDMRINKTIYYDGKNYNVQVSSWRNRFKAEQEVKRLRKEGYDAFVLIANLPEKGGIWYRVRIGSFKSEEEAKEFSSKNNF